jgi:NAD(P)-dependent dehydrogenase (short-subunit alcohol dehydrogenase family)
VNQQPEVHHLPLHGRHALVTGAGSGIGAAIAQALADAGAVLTLVGRRPDALAHTRSTLARSLEHGCCPFDVTDEAAAQAGIAQAAAERGPIAILVNNAGQAASQPFAKSDAAQWQAMLDVNLLGAVHATRAALPGMLAQGWGRVVNIASTAGLKGYAYVTAYCAAKHAVVGFTRALALETARKGVTVNAVCPGYTETPLLDEAVRNIVAKTGQSDAAARAVLAQHNPQGRLVRPEEVAHAVRWLCDEASAAITGQAIAVAGGEVM